MTEPISSDKGIGNRIAGYSEIAFKITEGRLLNYQIREDELVLYLNAGLATGFVVNKIAREGEECPWLKTDEYVGPGIHVVSEVVKKVI